MSTEESLVEKKTQMANTQGTGVNVKTETNKNQVTFCPPISFAQVCSPENMVAPAPVTRQPLSVGIAWGKLGTRWLCGFLPGTYYSDHLMVVVCVCVGVFEVKMVAT